MAGIKDTKIIKGQPHLLTYITPNEVEKLKALGGQETMTPEGIPAYPEFDNYTESSLAGTSSAGSGLTRSEFEGGAYSGTGNAGQALASANLINTQQAAAKKVREEKERQALKKQLESGPVNRNPYADFFSKQKIKSMNKAARRNKYKTLQELNQLPKDELSKSQLAFMAMNPLYGFGKLISGQTKVNPETDMFDIDSIREIGSQTQYTPTVDPVTGKTTYGTTANQAKQLGYLKQDIDMSTRKDITQNEFDEYMNRKKIPTFEGGGNPYILPQYAMMGADMGSEDAEPYNQFTYDENAFGPGGDSADVTRASYNFNQGGRAGKAEGGIMELRARRAFGGIMDRVTGRKAYGLGSIFKKIGKAAKKVLSSDIGKAAIAGAAIYYGGGGKFKSGGAKNFSFFGNDYGKGFFSKDNPLLFSGAADDRKFNALKAAGLFTLGGAMMGPGKQDSLDGFSNRGGHLIDPLTGKESRDGGPSMRENIELAKLEAGDDPDKLAAIDAKYNQMLNLKYHANLPDATPYVNYRSYGAANGGRIGKAEGGLMDLGGMEKDYRNDGGFVPIGEYEKKDDVPARLSVNEFVFTADAVRGAGQGDIDKGAEIMENMMKNLENGGTVSEESQGNKGAQQMFETSERLGAVI